MVNRFQVSVIIPVYNAADFVQHAVESALIQPQTSEVVIVEDGSTDNGLEVCQKIAIENNRVRLFRHRDGRNHGCSASRNLAVQNSSSEFVAFLDADDFYLLDRFAVAERLFAVDSELDGVYEAIGMYVEDNAGLQRWKDAKRALAPLTTMRRLVQPVELFDSLVTGGSGIFSIDGIVVRRSIFEKTGFFDENIRIHEDDIFKIKAAAVSKLAPGRLDEAVAMRRVHDHNTISEPRSNSLVYQMRLIFWSTLWKWSQNNLDQNKQHLIFQAMVKEAMSRTRFNFRPPQHLSTFQECVQLLMLPFDFPTVCKQHLFWRAFLRLIPPLKKYDHKEL
jgi:glycosyltransferase involved in cell wall biosynthesis